MFLMLMAGLSTAPMAEVAATVNGQAILVREIDTPSSAKITKLQEELRARAARAIDRLVDDRLRALAPTTPALSPSPAPITEEEIRAFRASRTEDFTGPLAPGGAARDPAVERAAIRYYLEQHARATAEVEVRRRLREGHTVELFLPDVREIEQVLPAEREVARVDGVSIRAAELERAAALPLYRLRGEIYRERRRNMEAAIENLLLTQEARRRGVSQQALLAKVSAGVTVSDEEVHAFIEAEQAAGRPVPTAERARPYLEFHKAYTRRQALLDQLRAVARIESLLKEPAAPRLPVVEAGAPGLGAQAGPRLVVYTNYRCTPCRAVHREIDRLLAADRTVRVVFRDFIPVYDPVATGAARLSRCAARLGAFARMRSELLTREPPAFGQPWYEEAALPSLASKLGIDPPAFRQCLFSAEIREAIERDTTHALELGFEEAPAFVAEGVPLSGLQSASGLARALHQEPRPSQPRTKPPP
jgi:protein-disulfide isomerase